MVNLNVNGNKYLVTDADAFNQILATKSQFEYLEIWASIEGQASLCALINARCGWLMFQRFQENDSSISRHPMSCEIDGETEMFLLANGQMDTYPKFWTFDRSAVFVAISEFVNSGEKPSGVAWQ